MQKLKRDYELISEAVYEFSEEYSLYEYMEARSLVDSRALLIQKNGSRKDKEFALIPWGDSFNHDHMSPTKWTYETGNGKGVQMKAYGNIAEGKEVTDTYVRMLPDTVLLTKYGFTTEKQNPNKMKIEFTASLLDDDPMLEKKISFTGGKQWKFLVNEFDSNEMNQLLSFLRILLIDDEENQVDAAKKMAFYKEKKYFPPLSSRNEKKVLDLFMNMCVAAYNRYP